MYVQDHDQKFQSDYGGSSGNSNWWMDAAVVYYDNIDDIRFCPTATDTEPTTGEDTMWVTVHETACDAWVASGQWRSPFDDNDDCVLDLDDYAAWAAAWLEDRSPSDPYIY